MEFRIQRILTFLVLALVASDAASSPELYWKSVLPNTPMPNAVKDLLKPDSFMEDKSTYVDVGKGGVNVDAGKGNPGGTSVNVGKGGVNVHAGKGQPGGGTHVAVGGGKGVGVNTGKPGHRTNVGVGKGGVSVSTGHKGKPVYVGVHPGLDPFAYFYTATETQLQDHRKGAIFFLEQDIHTGNVMNLHFTKSTNAATFLPRDEANSIPFSSSKLSEVFDDFSVKPGSLEAELMKNTVKECEDPGIEGEEKFCATSLESMIDFSTSKLGKNVQAISTEVGKENQKERFTITGVKKIGDGKTAVACHKQNYPYAVFYCHPTERTRLYMVQLVGVDGTKTKAVAVCHTNTGAWNPKHLAFQLLKVKPGSVPICHFLPEDHVVWVRN